MQYVIIGNSAAGIWAAETLRSLDKSSDITIIAEESLPAYSRCLLPDYLAGHKSEVELGIRSANFYEKNNIKTIFGSRVETVDVTKKEAVLDSGETVPYDKLLVATGASTFIPPVPGLKGDNVFGLRNLADAEDILAACKPDSKVVVIGGGFVGVETAYALRKRGFEVTVVEMLTQILPLQFDSTAAGILQQDAEQAGVKFILGKGVKEVVSPGFLGKLVGKVQSRVILEDQELEAGVIVVATGTRANTSLVKETGMTINKGIPVDDFMQTSVPDIYAAGDVAETKDAVTGKIDLTPIWPNAGIQGRIAAYNMAGIEKSYGGEVGMQNSVEFREVPAIAMGITDPTGDEYKVYANQFGQSYKKLIVKGNRLVGMVLVGDISQAGIYGGLIKNKLDISPYGRELMKDSFNYAHIYTTA